MVVVTPNTGCVLACQTIVPGQVIAPVPLTMRITVIARSAVGTVPALNVMVRGPLLLMENTCALERSSSVVAANMATE
ncbi:hypothetical protein D3C85_1545880 [compost metagenome]